jgi:hypothetical protein
MRETRKGRAMLWGRGEEAANPLSPGRAYYYCLSIACILKNGAPPTFHLSINSSYRGRFDEV